MDQEHRRDAVNVPGSDAWLAAGLAAFALGLWLLRRQDPFLMTLWGVALMVIGTVVTVVSIGLLLRIWR